MLLEQTAHTPRGRKASLVLHSGEGWEVIGFPIHPGAGCQGWAGSKMPSTSAPPLIRTWAYLALLEHKQHDNPNNSSIFSRCRWSFTLSKRGAQVKLPSPVPFPKAVGTLLLPLAALCITDPWSYSMAVLELETTADTGAHTVSTNLVHPCKCRNYMSVETEELPRETETQAEKVSTGLPPLEG